MSSLINQFKQTIDRKYKKTKPIGMSGGESGTTATSSRAIQRLRDIMSATIQRGGEETTEPQKTTDAITDAFTETTKETTTEGVSGDATVSDEAKKESEDVKEVTNVAEPVAKPVTTQNATDAKPQDLMKRMDDLTQLLKKQMAQGATATGTSFPTMTIPTMAMPSVAIPSMPSLNDAKGALEGAKSFLSLGASGMTNEMKDTLLAGMKILSDTVENYKRWADDYRERQEKLEQDAKTNPEYSKVRATFDTAQQTAVPKRSINPVKYIPIDVKRNARIPPTAQLDLPAMQEVTRLQDEIYGPRGKPQESSQLQQTGFPSQLGPFYRDPYIANLPAGVPVPPPVKPEDSATASSADTGDKEEGFFNISPAQIFNASLGLIAAQVGVVGYYLLKSM